MKGSLSTEQSKLQTQIPHWKIILYRRYRETEREREVHSTKLRESQKLLESRCHQSKVGGQQLVARKNVPLLTNKWVLQVQWVDTFLGSPFFFLFFLPLTKCKLTPPILAKKTRQERASDQISDGITNLEIYV
jgi:hypothetical protein